MCGRLKAILRILEIIETLMPGGASLSEEEAFAALGHDDEQRLGQRVVRL